MMITVVIKHDPAIANNIGRFGPSRMGILLRGGANEKKETESTERDQDNGNTNVIVILILADGAKLTEALAASGRGPVALEGLSNSFLKEAIEEDPDILDYDKYLEKRDSQFLHNDSPAAGAAGRSKYMETAAIWARHRQLENRIRDSMMARDNPAVGPERKRYVSRAYTKHLKEMDDAMTEMKRTQGKEFADFGRMMRNSKFGINDITSKDAQRALQGPSYDMLNTPMSSFPGGIEVTNPDDSSADNKEKEEKEEEDGGNKMEGKAGVSSNYTATCSSGDTPDTEDYPKRVGAPRRWINWNPNRKDYVENIGEGGPKTLEDLLQYDQSYKVEEDKMERRRIMRKSKRDQLKAEMVGEQAAKREEQRFIEKFGENKMGNETKFNEMLEDIHRRARPVVSMEEIEAIRKGSGVLEAKHKKEKLVSGKRKKVRSIAEVRAENEAIQSAKREEWRRKRAMRRAREEAHRIANI
eukprot:jgi/Bigna1/87090/estExt_fgenesh1_pg.C_160206